MIVTPDNAPKAWTEAGREAARRLAEDSPGNNDCQEVRVDVGSPETRVTLFTRDERSATRPIRSPDQLAATVSALASTILAPPETAATPPARPATPTPPPAVVVTPRPAHIVAHALVGEQIGLPGNHTGTQLALSTGLAFGLGEIGAFIDWTPSISAKDAPAGTKTWAVKTGARGGLRAPVGPVSILAGGLLGVGVMNETAPEPSAAVGKVDHFGTAVAEPIFGAYAGAAWPKASALRLRAQIVVDSVLTRAGKTLNLDSRLPDLPAWSMSFQLGIEGQPL